MNLLLGFLPIQHVLDSREDVMLTVSEQAFVGVGVGLTLPLQRSVE